LFLEKDSAIIEWAIGTINEYQTKIPKKNWKTNHITREAFSELISQKQALLNIEEYSFGKKKLEEAFQKVKEIFVSQAERSAGELIELSSKMAKYELTESKIMELIEPIKSAINKAGWATSSFIC